ncbi:hypothetical protein FE156_00495 [Streptomyces albidoflavus]|nr:hypothetical protein FE156_00495 [Streptomyces albidoflavus]
MRSPGRGEQSGEEQGGAGRCGHGSSWGNGVGTRRGYGAGLPAVGGWRPPFSVPCGVLCRDV